ncbi:MAG TPA: hypothetical protein VJ825_09010 [Gemmatimonadaceae bacterium]|nr:hypothetical protein [Gemmatimonadaceae bacterium]
MARNRARDAAVPITPANIRIDSVTLDDDDRAVIRRKTRTRFARFGRAVERVTVRIRDVNGPRGGVDIECRIKVVLSRLPSVVAERRAKNFEGAFGGALAAASRAVSQAVRRRRMRPIKATRSRRGSAV